MARNNFSGIGMLIWTTRNNFSGVGIFNLDSERWLGTILVVLVYLIWTTQNALRLVRNNFSSAFLMTMAMGICWICLISNLSSCPYEGQALKSIPTLGNELRQASFRWFMRLRRFYSSRRCKLASGEMDIINVGHLPDITSELRLSISELQL